MSPRVVNLRMRSNPPWQPKNPVAQPVSRENQSHAGALQAGGAAEVRVNSSIGTVNLLHVLTYQFNIVGGTVSNPQPQVARGQARAILHFDPPDPLRRLQRRPAARFDSRCSTEIAVVM
jgi:hypothetical protein